MPVMVFLHGGSFTGGSGTLPMFDGSRFAQAGVVLVTVNYRLGRLGFFAHPALTTEQAGRPLANYGMMDNLAALRWVQRNIRNFGGDPKNVTAFGESAGGILINDLMSSPKARSLFARAISQSGFGRLEGEPMAQAEQSGIAIATRLGVTTSGADALRALRSLTAAELSKLTGPVTPILDGVILPESPAKAFAAGHELKVPYIVGGNSWEATVFPQRMPLDKAGALRQQIISVYGSSSDMKSVQWDLSTESLIIEPNRLLARLHVKNGHSAWVYYDSYVPAAQRAMLHGVPHGGELMYVFGTLPDTDVVQGHHTIPAATPADKRVSAAMTAAWAAFARSGDPSTASVFWPRYGPSDAVMEFGADTIVLQQHFHGASLDVIEQFNRAGGGF